MGKKPQVGDLIKGKVLAHARDGYSIREIAAMVGISKSYGGSITKRFNESGSTDVLRRPGRPSLCTRRKLHQLKRLIYRNLNETSKELSWALSSTAGAVIKPRTIRDWCNHRLGLCSRKPGAKPLLTFVQRQRRIEFRRQYACWGENEWKSVLFTDETMIRQFSSNKNHVRRPANSRSAAQFTIPTTKKAELVMVWGCLSSSGRGSIYFLPKGATINADLYREILEDKMLLSYKIHESQYLVHDNTSCHAAKK